MTERNSKNAIYVYVTKYAMSKGVFKLEVERTSCWGDPDRLLEDLQHGVHIKCFGLFDTLVFGKECFLDANEAEQDAKDRAKARVVQLEKQVEQARKRVVKPKWRAGDKPEQCGLSQKDALELAARRRTPEGGMPRD